MDAELVRVRLVPFPISLQTAVLKSDSDFIRSTRPLKGRSSMGEAIRSGDDPLAVSRPVPFCGGCAFCARAVLHGVFDAVQDDNRDWSRFESGRIHM